MGAQTFEIELGRGLDRAAGHLAAHPSAMRDLRNVYVRDGQLEARKGCEETVTIPADTIVNVSAFTTEQAGVLVGYTETSRKLDLYLVDGFGQGPALPIGEWGTLPTGAHTPPRVLAAEAANRLFFAHDEVQLTRRMPTMIYQPFAPETLAILRQDLGEEVDVKFRGVTTHLSYIVGWGFGTADDQDRPEAVRISLPGLFDPETNQLTFLKGHYWMLGTRGDPVVRCIPLGLDQPALLALKSAETHLLYGYDSRTFGSQRIDSRFGAASSRLVVTYGGAVFVWSLEGPRVFQRPGASEDLAIPLNLRAPPPASLVSSGAIENGWAEYVPERRAIRFVFGELKYVLHLWDPSRPEWSYEEGEDEFCGGIIFGGGTPVFAPPAGAPSLESVTDVTTTSAVINIAHSNAEGNEVLEVWIRPSGGDWARLTPELVELPGPQAVHATDLASGVSYDVAPRYRRGPHFTPGYGGDDPSQWPSYVPDAFTTMLGAPQITAAVWERVSQTAERCTLNITPASLTELRIYRSDDNGQTWNLLATIAQETHAGDPLVYHDDTIVGEVYVQYKAVHFTSGAGEGEASNVVTLWTGPIAPQNVTVDDGDGQRWYSYRLTWDSVAEYTIEIKDDYECRGAFAPRATAPSSGDTWFLSLSKKSTEEDTGANGVPAVFNTRIRHVLQSFDVTDHSDWVERLVTVRIAEDETAYNACAGGGGGPGDNGGHPDPEPE